MGFWSTLGTIGKALGGIGATVATGGAAAPALIPSILGSLGQVSGAIAGGRAQGRNTEANTNIAAYNAQNNATNSAAATDLARKRYLNSAPSAYAGQSLLSDIMKNVGDVHLNVPGVNTNVTGGLRPSNMGANSQDAASALGAVARSRMAQLPMGTANSPTSYFSGAASPVSMPQPGALDSILGGIGTFGSLAGAVLPYLNKQAPRPQLNNPNATN